MCLSVLEGETRTMRWIRVVDGKGRKEGLFERVVAVKVEAGEEHTIEAEWDVISLIRWFERVRKHKRVRDCAVEKMDLLYMSIL